MSQNEGVPSLAERLLQGDYAQQRSSQRPLSEQHYQFAAREPNGNFSPLSGFRQQNGYPVLRENPGLPDYQIPAGPQPGEKRRPVDPRQIDVGAVSERLKAKHGLDRQGIDRWKLEQKNPVYNNQEVFVSPIRPYTTDSNSSSPLRKQMSRTAVSSAQTRPCVETSGNLFNFEPQANLPYDEVCGDLELPSQPEWIGSRPFLSGKFLYNSTGLPSNDPQVVEPLRKYPRQLQDTLIVDDLLNVFLGVDGTYISAKLVRGLETNHLVYTLDVDMDVSLKELASKMLPLSECAVLIERFAETRSAYQWGFVCHAFSGAMREILEDWRLLVTQLEHQYLTNGLNLQGLWFHCQKPLATLQLVASLAGEAAAGQLRGAAVLNLLDQKLNIMAGDVNGMSILQRLLTACCKPYFEMLESWLCRGCLCDPYAEFMVSEDKAVAHDSVNDDNESAYWTERYVLRMTRPDNRDETPKPEVPRLLESHMDSILATGKYLNIVRECGKDVERTLPADVHLVYDKRQDYLQKIVQANRNASAAVMNLMQKDVNISAILQALKHFFLVDRGDIILSFLDTAEEEMAKPTKYVSLPRLQTLLELAVRQSTGVAAAKGDELFCTIDTRRLQPMLHDLRPQNARRKLKDHLSTPQRGAGDSMEDDAFSLTTQVGREVFMLGYKVTWPVNLIVTKAAMGTYQLIFRHLFELKCVERELNKVWKVYQKARLIAEDSKGGLKAAFGLCQRMMHFFHQYLLYVTFEVLEPHWLALCSGVRTAKTLDEIMTAHRSFLQRALGGTVLKSKMVRTLTDMKALVYNFSRESSALDVDNELAEDGPVRIPRGKSKTQMRHEMLSVGSNHILQILDETEYALRISSIDRRFNHSMAAFITGLRDVHRGLCQKADANREEVESVQNLITRLDFNEFFASGTQHANVTALGYQPHLQPVR